MAKLTFKDLSFDDKGDKIRVNFLRIFYFHINKQELEQIDHWKRLQTFEFGEF